MTTRLADYLSPTDQRRRFVWSAALAKLGPFIGLIFVYLLFAVLVNVVPGAQRFATPGNMELMLRQTAVVGTAALGMTLIIISGGIDLSVGANIALSTVVVASTLLSFGGSAPALAACAGVATAALAGLFVGLLVTGLRLSPFIVTLGTWGAYRGLAKGLAGNTRVYPAPLEDPDAWRRTWLSGLIDTLPAERRWMLLPPGVWAMIGLAVLVACVLRYTRFGRHVFAIGSNEQTARLCGVRIRLTKILIYLSAGALVGVAAVLDFSYTGAGDPVGRMGAELDVIAAVVIGGASLSGGQGSVLGSLVGALIMTMVANGCTKLGLPNWVQEIATGGIIIFAVALDRLRQRRGAYGIGG
jgi:ribose/xylose/arabinose/galactoside ABC-type transport system permease subunit